MIKPLALLRAPLATRSGYGDMSRDIARHLIELDRYEVKILSVDWGGTAMDALNENNPRDKIILDHILNGPLQRQPELYIQISTPHEFQPMGKFNVGITAGIETTLCSIPWIDGCNKMNTVWLISEHGKKVFESTKAQEKNPQGQLIRDIAINVPLDVLHNCVDTNIFRPVGMNEIPKTINDELKQVKEKFAFLFVGHWLRGELGQDRKDVGMLVKVFCEVFKDNPSAPALILKTSGATFSVMDRESILDRIKQIKSTVNAKLLPRVYLMHGSLTEDEMNGLYNHPKVKAHVSFTKGEGFARPLLEACMSEKPIMASGWSGHLDFLNPQDSVLLNGQLTPVHPSAAWENVILKESSWFTVDYNNAGNFMKDMFENYKKYAGGAVKLAEANRKKFNYDTIKSRLAELLDKYVPPMAVEVPIVLPPMKIITQPIETPSMSMPELSSNDAGSSNLVEVEG